MDYRALILHITGDEGGDGGGHAASGTVYSCGRGGCGCRRDGAPGSQALRHQGLTCFQGMSVAALLSKGVGTAGAHAAQNGRKADATPDC
jgi:hypothetical protein